jgi:hypothetical protein
MVEDVEIDIESDADSHRHGDQKTVERLLPAGSIRQHEDLWNQSTN